MRLRTALVAVTGAFSYRYVGLSGAPRSVTLHAPRSPGCVPLAEVAGPGSSQHAFTSHSDTDEWVMVFTEPDCTGDSWPLRPHGQPATHRLTLRSVYFTGRRL